MNAVAPVCPISRSQPISGAPGLLYPVLPAVIDLPSAIAAVNMLAPYINHLGGISAAPNNMPHVPTYTTLKNNNSGGIQGHNWVENTQKRVVIQKKIYKGDYGAAQADSDLWVTVARLMHMEMRDTVTGWTLVWDYGDDGQ